MADRLPPVFEFIGEISDEAIEALAALLLDAVKRESSGGETVSETQAAGSSNRAHENGS